MAHFSYFVAIATFAFSGFSAADPVIQMPPECEGSEYCIQQPEEHKALVSEMDKAIKRSKYWDGLGSSLSIDGPVYQPDDDNCGYIRETIEPFIIKANTTNENKLVVQTKKFRQKIEVTRCLDKQQSCLDALKAVQDDIATCCDERYAVITLYVFEKKKIVAQSVSVPVSCSCKVKFT